MKTYERLKQIRPAEFKRLVGVKKETSEVMLDVYSEYHEKKKQQGGRPNLLLPETQLLLMLEYYREYRSVAHMALDYEISEPTASRIIKEVETVLIHSGKSSLPGKKALHQEGGIELEYIVIDATECPVQRPKKDNGVATVGRKSVILPKDKL
ncbi:transposase family protein [Sulfurospirillum halorespirans]|uniref:Putative transposase n=1 Tax=Sulfurospirillum halorespirans DSM 13726 TaxID=1193502 RepID=A0A1D7TLM1_9BACT|nr:putative transposase [Sulfurospirillum halorespirans DSM 13726]